MLKKERKKEYLICAHCVRHVQYVMQRLSRDRLLSSMAANSLLDPEVLLCIDFNPFGQQNFTVLLPER